MATRMFAGNKKVAFGDINLSEAGVRGEPYNPGSGGWPTIRYFTKETGLDGASYEKKTSKSMCDELGDVYTMIEYIEEASSAALCDIDGSSCNEKELAYLEKWKAKPAEEVAAQKERLDNMEVKQLKEDLQEWNYRRRRILQRLLLAADSTGDEL